MGNLVERPETHTDISPKLGKDFFSGPPGDSCNVVHSIRVML